jgi:hypothetical protein
MTLDRERLETLVGRLYSANDKTLSGLSKAVFTYLEREASGNPRYALLKNQIPTHSGFKLANGATDGGTWSLPDNPDSLAFALFYWIAHGEYFPTSLYPVNSFEAKASCFVNDFTPHLIDALGEIFAAEPKPVATTDVGRLPGDPHLGDVVINATNSHVTLQHGGQGNVQKVHISSRSDVSRHLDDLKRMISESKLEVIDKEEAHSEISRVNELSTKNLTPDVLKRIDDRLGVIGSIVARASDLAVSAAPVIEAVRRLFGG